MNTRGTPDMVSLLFCYCCKYFLLNSTNLTIKPSVWIVSLHSAIQHGIFEWCSRQSKRKLVAEGSSIKDNSGLEKE